MALKLPDCEGVLQTALDIREPTAQVKANAGHRLPNAQILGRCSQDELRLREGNRVSSGAIPLRLDVIAIRLAAIGFQSNAIRL